MRYCLNEDLLLKHRRTVSERTDGHQWEEQERDDDHSGKYRHKDRLPFTIFRAMRGTRPPVPLPTFETEDLANTTRE